MDDTQVDPDGGIITPSDGDRLLLDTEADMPAEWVLQQPRTGNAPPAGFIRDR